MFSLEETGQSIATAKMTFKFIVNFFTKIISVNDNLWCEHGFGAGEDQNIQAPSVQAPEKLQTPSINDDTSVRLKLDAW